MYDAQILLDSVTPDGVRLTTMQVTYPHAVHKDIMTHRVFSRNYQSFRAVPPEKLIASLREDPFVPEVFGFRLPGMGQRNEILEEQELIDQGLARQYWFEHLIHAIDTAEKFLKLNIAKQQVNFVLQDFCWITGIITSTEWDNFWALRATVKDPNAQPRPEVKKIAGMMLDEYWDSTPRPLQYGDWHLPLVSDTERWDSDMVNPILTGADDISWDFWKKVAVGRCARVSYLTHDGKHNPAKDIELHDRLQANGHMSPFEHVAQATPKGYGMGQFLHGNFRKGWIQYRKEIPNEALFTEVYDGVL